MRPPREAHEAERAITGFRVFELADGSWRAVSKLDRALIIEHPDWKELAWACVSARITAELRVAAEDFARRMAEPGRTWRHNGPGSGINA